MKLCANKKATLSGRLRGLVSWITCITKVILIPSFAKFYFIRLINAAKIPHPSIITIALTAIIAFALGSMFMFMVSIVLV